MNLKQQWTLIPWDGNPALKLQCWRKKFKRGHVSVGHGDFTAVVFSYGANSDFSGSCTRNRQSRILTEHEAMALVDEAGGDLDTFTKLAKNHSQHL